MKQEGKQEQTKHDDMPRFWRLVEQVQKHKKQNPDNSKDVNVRNRR